MPSRSTAPTPTGWRTTYCSRSRPWRASEVEGRAASGNELTVHGAEVSAVRRDSGALEVRVFNPTPRVTEVSFPGRSGWLGTYAATPWVL